MIFVALSGALVGAVFGLRFKVLSLLLAIILGLIGIAIISIFSGTLLVTALCLMIAWPVALQVGYLSGLLIQFVMVGTRVRPSPSELVLSRRPPTSAVAND